MRFIHFHIDEKCSSGVLAYGSPKDVEEKVLELLKIYEDSPLFIMNAGCAIPPETPEENIYKMVEVTRNY
ncbi:MAG: uroporphyrinogen decarboxylase family protein [Bacteroidota bacterium]